MTMNRADLIKQAEIEEALAKKIRQSTGKLTTTNFMAEIIVGVCKARAAALRALAGDMKPTSVTIFGWDQDAWARVIKWAGEDLDPSLFVAAATDAVLMGQFLKVRSRWLEAGGALAGDEWVEVPRLDREDG